jgi:hypothetical protein
MSRITASFLSAPALLLAVPLALASNFAVGTCKPSLPSYSSISAAVSAVPAGSTVQVCPGTYAEQVFISQALTLEGITSGNSSDVVITTPGSGLTIVTDDFGFLVAPMVEVNAAVNISNITVDGNGNGVGGAAWLAGFFYGDGSSGTLTAVTVRNLSDSGLGSGVWASSSVAGSVTINSSGFHNIDDSSVISLGSISLTAKGNSMQACCFNVQAEATATVNLSGNFVNSSACCTAVQTSSPGTIAGNTITNPNGDGILVFPFGGGQTVSNNKISNALTGIVAEESGDTYKSNTIIQTGTAIELNCTTPIVTSNTITDAAIGLDGVPPTFGSTNKFNSVITIRNNNCADGKHPGRLPGKPGVPTPAPSH